MEDAKSIIEKGIEVWNAHDREGFLSLYDEKIVFVNEAEGLTLHGCEELGKGFFDLWTDAYPDNELKVTRLIGEGELVCFEGRFIGTNTGIFHGPAMEMPPTGKQIDAPFVFVAEVQGGKVKTARHYYDRLLALEQEGVISLKDLAAQFAVA